MKLLVVVLLWTTATVGDALPKAELFPFGREQHLPAADDVSSPEVALAVPVVFYGTEYRSIYVNDNGLLSFLTEVPSFFNAQFPLTYPIIAPFYSDVDVRSAGRIYYRETQQAELLERATRDVRSHFSSAGAFQARSLFVATWDEVGRYDRAPDQVNTFQVVLASDGHDTFAYFLYPTGGMQWIQGQGKNPNLPDARAQAGFMSGDGRLYTLRGSGTEQARNFDRMSNTRQAGVWMFQLGRGAEGNVMPADLDFSPDTEHSDARTCADALEPCPPHSECLDRPGGLCCVCKEGLFGNGRNCVEKNSPQRMNGKVSGFVNDVALDDVDLHAYIVTEDGRTYTAVSRVPHAVGTDLQLLTPLGGVIGWLFAVSRSGAPNGFTITGGAFNRTVEVDYPQTGHHVFVEESFLGPDVFNYMRVQVRLRGSVPSVPLGSKIEVDDYEEEFTRVAPGLIRSHSSRSYRLEGNGLEVPFTLDQTIQYAECVAPLSSTRLKVARNFIVYDAHEQIVRYAMTSKVSPLAVEDPCEEGRQQCGPNSQCVVEGDSFRCACVPGYQPLYEEDQQATCLDSNECVLGRDNCHVFADCINLPGSFACRCRPGYKGDGIQCERQQSCADLICDVQAECVERDGPRCRCRRGFVGDGLTCRAADSDDCRHTDYCDPRAECVHNEAAQRHECRCRTGYTGDGIVCVEVSCDVAADCSPDGDCLYDEEGEAYYCACRPGFSGDGYACSPESARTPCDDSRPCHASARCLYDAASGRHGCRCLAGFRGDGHSCSPDRTPCDDDLPCHRFGECYFDGDQHRCRCAPPHVGDGYLCRHRDERTPCDAVRRCHDSAECVYDVANGGWHSCSCLAGFHGDGFACSAERPPHGCHQRLQCHRYAECIGDGATNRTSCRCVPPYLGDGQVSCVRAKELGCERAGGCSPQAACVRDDHGYLSGAADSYLAKHVCRCNEGYEGDGKTCQPIDECNTAENCHPHAQCLYDPPSQRYRCRCLDGFQGDGRRDCRPERDEGCDHCDPNADCLYDGPAQRHFCRCRPGFREDGPRCVRAALSCDVVNSCDVRAECVPERGAHRCRCRPGYEGDGLRCRPLRSCRDDRRLCDPDADCVPGDEDGEYVCRCRRGYIGDGLQCSAAPQHSGGQLVFAQGMSLLRVPPLPSKSDPGQLLLMEPRQTPVGLAADCRQGRLYWADASLKVLRTARYDGSDVDIIVSEDMLSPEGVAVDWLSRTLFWTDSGKDTIEVVGLSKPYRKVLISEGLDNPRGIAVHPGLGKVYWSDWRRSAPKIESADMDGGNRQELVSDVLQLPNMIVVDYEKNNLCWTDSGLGRIECIGVDGQGRRLVYTPAAYPFGIAVHGAYIYWTDWEIKFLHRVDSNGGEAEPLEVPPGGSGRMYGLVSLPSSCPAVGSPCAVDNGGCRHLCLAKGRGGRSCVCPDTDEDDSEGIDCNEPV